MHNPYRRAIQRFSIRRLSILGILLAFFSMAFAQNCVQEFEPNDTPMNAVDLADARCFVGEMADQDQDLWVWHVTEDDATAPWTITIEGIPGQPRRSMWSALPSPRTAPA